MVEELRAEIISPKGYLFNGNCHLITIPSVDGDIGIMSNHEAVLARLKEGNITIFDKDEKIQKEFSIKSGFAEIFNNKLLVLVD